jgi:hypothetical protein
MTEYISYPHFETEIDWQKKAEIIESIRNLNLEEVTADEAASLVTDLMEGTRFVAFSLPLGMSFFRGIKFENKPTRKLDLIYPPVDKSRINRANVEGQQLFYCTTTKKAVFYESDVKVGERLVISNWINHTERILVNTIGYTIEELDELSEIYNSLLTPRANRDLSEENIKMTEYLKQVFSEKIENKFKYKITNAIANNLYGEHCLAFDFHNGRVEIAGLLYHTTRLDNKADNVALKPNIINANMLELQQVEYVEVAEKKDDKYIYKLLDHAECIENDVIQWKNLQSTWLLDDESDDIFFTETDQGYKICTIEGDLIESL